MGTIAKLSPRYCLAAWRITHHCNFRCPYCYSGREASPDAPGGERLDLWAHIDTVEANLLAADKDWTLGFTGGEPLIYPRFADICGRLAKNFRIYLDTNLSRPIDSLLEQVPAGKMEMVYAALHIFERTDRRAMDVFIRNAQLLKQGGYPLAVNFVMYPPLIDQFERIRDLLGAQGIEITPKSFKGVFQGQRYPESYTESQRALILKYSPSDARTREIPDFFGIPCNAGHKLVRIVEDGTVMRCNADKTILGNVFTGLSLHQAPMPCQVHHCPCYGTGKLFDGIDWKDHLRRRDEQKGLCETA